MPTTTTTMSTPPSLSVLHTLTDRTIVITGATSFVGRALVEKLLRCVPNVGRVYLLIRARSKGGLGVVSAADRLVREIVRSDVFDRLRDEYIRAGSTIADFEAFAASKLHAVSYDLAQPQLGLSPADLATLTREGECVFHTAGVTDFDERLDRAAEVNVRGTLRVLELCAAMPRCVSVVHMSSCYVNANRHGTNIYVDEQSLPILGFDPAATLADIESMSSSQLTTAVASGGFLRQYPNTYTFTKAMAEHLAVAMAGGDDESNNAPSQQLQPQRIPLTIVRPSIIGAAWREPQPGWIDATSPTAAVYAAVGFGVLRFMHVHGSRRTDFIPVDAVVNSLLVAAAARVQLPSSLVSPSSSSLRSTVSSTSTSSSELSPLPSTPRHSTRILHCSSTAERNPLYYGPARSAVVKYFRANPPSHGGDGSSGSGSGGAADHPPVSFSFVNSPQAYQLWFFLYYSIPSSMLKSLVLLFETLGVSSAAARMRSDAAEAVVTQVRRVTNTFRPFVESEWIFDNAGTKSLAALLPRDEQRVFNVAAADINWAQYLADFAAGIKTHVLHEQMIGIPYIVGDGDDGSSINSGDNGGGSSGGMQTTKTVTCHSTRRRRNYRSLTDPAWLHGPPRSSVSSFWMPDLTWARSATTAYPATASMPQPRPLASMKRLILATPRVTAAINTEAADTGVNVHVVTKRAQAIVDKMFADMSLKVHGSLAWWMRKMFRQLYHSINVDSDGVQAVRAAAKIGPLVMMPTHRSYIDFLVTSYLTFVARLPMPYIAAGEDFLGIIFVRWLFRKSGAFFIRRTFASDRLYLAIFAAYTQQLLIDGHTVEFFIEGTRSRGGKMLHPKTGMLSMITDAYLDGVVPNMTIVPITINYEQTMEANMYSGELMGESKVRESLKNMVFKGSQVLSVNFGEIYVAFGALIDLKAYTQMLMTTTPVYPFPRRPTSLHADTHDWSVPLQATVPQLTSSSSSSAASATAATSTPVTPQLFNPYDKSLREHRVYFNDTLAYSIVYSLSTALETLPTYMVATLLLMYRQGITHEQLVTRTDWLRCRLMEKEANMVMCAGRHKTQMVDRAIDYLASMVVQNTNNVLEPDIKTRSSYKNMLGLGHYRNKIGHFFYLEGLWAVCLYALGARGATSAQQGRQQQSEHSSGGSSSSSSSSSPRSSSSGRTQRPHTQHGNISRGVHRDALLPEVRFLSSLLHREFIYKESAEADSDEELLCVLNDLTHRGVFSVSPDGVVSVTSQGESHFSFLCALMWPFIDSYYISSLFLFSLQPDRVVDINVVLQRTQGLATTLYHQQMICFFESCNIETLKNAFNVLCKWHVISVVKVKSDGFSSGGGGGMGGMQFVTAAITASKPRTIKSYRLTTPFQREETLHALVSRIDALRKTAPVKRDYHRHSLIADVPALAKL